MTSTDFARIREDLSIGLFLDSNSDVYFLGSFSVALEGLIDLQFLLGTRYSRALDFLLDGFAPVCFCAFLIVKTDMASVLMRICLHPEQALHPAIA